MSLIRPFTGLRPMPRRAAEVIAPPYDVLSTEEARLRVQGKSWSFLHISKPEIDLPVGTDPHSPAVYAKGKENFQKMIKEGVLARDPEPCYYVYRLIMGAHQQTGIVAAASIRAYDANRVRKHEFTRPDKEDDRVRQIEALNAQTGPVFLTYRHASAVEEIVDRVTLGTADVDIDADDGVQHTLWVMRDSHQIDAITGLFDSMDCLYIADGHHRSAAASRVAAAWRAKYPQSTGNESFNYFLAVIFPDNQMQILDYNRVLKDLNSLSRASFLQAIESAFTVKVESTMVKPGRTGEFGMYMKGQWYRLNIKPERIPASDPVRRLDVSLLQDNLIAPVLGIDDPRRDKRIDFVGGIRGLKELVRRVDSGEMACAFSMYPTSIADLMAVADAGQVLPPKSTWFEPKLADGLVSHVLD
ncbi:MAG: DUF1015 family protein [Sulfuricaulis sp.]|nr:DUF1015 family protein [Sulfuricaulis sp.]